MSLIRRNGMRWSCLGVVALLAAGCGDDSVSPVAESDACATIQADVQGSFDALAELVAVETYRTENFANEDILAANMETIYGNLSAQIQEFNAGQKTNLLELTEWRHESGQEGEPKDYWVFSVRLGKGPYKVALSTHLDTVSPGDTSAWQPFTLTKETEEYGEAGPQDFWVGRGAIDDKGPALTTLQVLKTIARAYDGNPLLDDISVELLFDTSEETSMSMPHYLDASPKEEMPDLAVIFDSAWCVRAEKGIERPVFTIPRGTPPTEGVWIESLNTPPGPTNQIADTAEAILHGSQTELDALAATIETTYKNHVFDDPNYKPAELTVDTSGLPDGELKLITKVAGAQHGSAPDENREGGANPLVSLANFLSDLVKNGDLVDNDVGRMCTFINWMWGTEVFGEKHPVLESHDEVFTEGNGTTYAVTRISTGVEVPDAISLRVDIRYAIGHHSETWDGKTEGFLCGEESKFHDIFTTLVNDFNDDFSDLPVTFDTQTRDAPDIRLPEGPTFSKVSEAYQSVMGTACPAVATGGGTDAKGHTKFLAAGALFDDHLGPPINMHGIHEGAPVRDLSQSANILCHLVDQEIQHAAEAEHDVEEPANTCGANQVNRSTASRTGSDWH